MSKPLPTPDDLTAAFWTGCQNGHFLFQQCVACGHSQFPPRYTCVQCHNDQLRWQAACGRGELYSFTVNHRAPLDSFKADVPYVLAIIKLDEGVRALMNLRDAEPGELRLGMRVQLFFEQVGGSLHLPQARPQPMFTFETFKTGELLGRKTLVLDQALVDQWHQLFSNHDDKVQIPPGMTAIIYSRAYSSILQPRPPGNVHGEQTFNIHRLPHVGERLVTDLRCVDKHLKGSKRWVTFASDTRNENSELLFSSHMTTLWAR